MSARVQGEALEVSGSAALLERAVENLVDNAFRCGAKRVELLVLRRGAQVVLEVSDDGPGVAPAVRDRLFELFASGRGSTGLGLVLVKDIAVAHGGTVQLEPSIAGARFTLVLPSRQARADIVATGCDS